MSWRELPEGVPPTNEKQDFAAPDTATPGFVHGGLDDRSHRRIHEKHEVYERVEEEDEDEEETLEHEHVHHHHHNEGPNVIHVMIAIGLLLLALAAIVVANNREKTPLCSTQPEWNQYNCLPG